MVFRRKPLPAGRSSLPFQGATKSKIEESSNQINVLITEHRLEAHLGLPTVWRILIGKKELSP